MTSTFQVIFHVCGCPESPLNTGLMYCRWWWHKGHWMHTFFFFFFLLVARQPDTNKCDETQSKKEYRRQNKWDRSKTTEEERTISYSYLHDQDDHAYGSQQVLVVIQPFLHFLEAALKWNKSLWKCAFFFKKKKKCAFSVCQRNHVNHRKDMHLSRETYPARRMRRRWGVKQMNYPWVTTFICRLVGHMERRVR